MQSIRKQQKHILWLHKNKEKETGSDSSFSKSWIEQSNKTCHRTQEEVPAINLWALKKKKRLNLFFDVFCFPWVIVKRFFFSPVFQFLQWSSISYHHIQHTFVFKYLAAPSHLAKQFTTMGFMASCYIRRGIDWIVGKLSLLKESWSIGTGCPGKPSSHQLWRCLKNV